MSTQPTLRPSSSRPSSTSVRKSTTSSPTTSAPPKPPISAHPTAIVPDSATFHGTHPVSIGAGTIIHPRAKIYSFHGAVSFGEGCIVGEKSVIGGPLPPTSSRPVSLDTTPTATSSSSSPTIIENSVLIGPLATVSAGTHISTAAVIDTAAVLGRDVRIGQHVKICASCEIRDGVSVGEWMVVMGGGGGGERLRMRKRASNAHSEDGGLGGRSVEAGRLVVLNREREGLTKLIGVGSGGGGSRRR
ncbi:hypothetical protein AJ80_06549 [Polytolypa hystricis UAMH7299]|uniref:Dynactin subunit 6 n=1 Tax=Polytolypa hystricis (strain UAMH7299) TaxID=1447883 RepID=A0A2B7XV11_POLH7|nr:hypothetical protein AJ80_06549 [Polytolypa hystricis UAMH7299]